MAPFLEGLGGSGKDFGSILERLAGVWARFLIDFGGVDRKKPNSCLNLCIFGFRSIFWIDFSWICLGFGILGVFVGFGRLRCSNTLLTGVC